MKTVLRKWISADFSFTHYFNGNNFENTLSRIVATEMLHCFGCRVAINKQRFAEMCASEFIKIKSAYGVPNRQTRCTTILVIQFLFFAETVKRNEKPYDLFLTSEDWAASVETVGTIYRFCDNLENLYFAENRIVTRSFFTG